MSNSDRAGYVGVWLALYDFDQDGNENGDRDLSSPEPAAHVADKTLHIRTTSFVCAFSIYLSADWEHRATASSIRSGYRATFDGSPGVVINSTISAVRVMNRSLPLLFLRGRVQRSVIVVF